MQGLNNKQPTFTFFDVNYQPNKSLRPDLKSDTIYKLDTLKPMKSFKNKLLKTGIT